MQHYVRPEDHLTTRFLPPGGYLWIDATVDVYTSESVEHGGSDRNGYVSTIEQPDEPTMNEEGMVPVFVAALPLDEEKLEELRRLIAHIGAVESDRWIAAVDTVTYDMTTDETWSYALHPQFRVMNTLTAQWAHTEPVRILEDAS